MQLILGAVIGLCFFIVPMWAYRRGIKDGLAIQQGKAPEPIKTPSQVIQSHKEAKQVKATQDQFMQGLNNILSYDGTPQKAGDKD